MQPWTILELKYLHIELQMSSYVNVKAIKLITLFVGFTEIYKAPWASSHGFMYNLECVL